MTPVSDQRLVLKNSFVHTKENYGMNGFSTRIPYLIGDAAVFLSIMTLGTATHELGHKLAFNAVCPGIATMKVNFWGGHVTLNPKFSNELYEKALTCARTRFKIAGCIAAGPIAGLTLGWGLLHCLRKIKDSRINHADSPWKSQNGKRTFNWLNQDLLVTAYLATVTNLITNALSIITTDPIHDGPKIYSILFTKRLILGSSSVIEALKNNPSFQHLSTTNQLPSSLRWKALGLIHANPSNEVEKFFNISQHELSLLKEQTKPIWEKFCRTRKTLIKINIFLFLATTTCLFNFGFNHFGSYTNLRS